MILTQCNSFLHKEAVEYIINILWVNRMPYILPWDADSSKNKKTCEGLLRITDDPMKVITLQLIETLPNVEKVLILGGSAWNFFGDMIPELVSRAGPITHPMNWFKGRVRENQQERAMTVIPGIISGSTIPSRDTWNEYIKVTANMLETAIKLRRKKKRERKRKKSSDLQAPELLRPSRLREFRIQGAGLQKSVFRAGSPISPENDDSPPLAPASSPPCHLSPLPAPH